MIELKKTMTHDDIAIVKVNGWLEDFSCPFFSGKMEQLIRDGHREIVIDCEDLGLISSSCLNSLIKARKRATKGGGQIVLANVNASILEVIGFLGLTRLFGIYPSVDRALIKVRRKMRRKDRKHIEPGTVN